MSYGYYAFISILLCLSVVACKDQNAKPGATPVNSQQVTQEVIQPVQRLPIKTDSDVNSVPPSTESGEEPKERFDQRLAESVVEITGRTMADGITTWDASGNPSETKFADGSRIVYASGELHQFIDANGKTTSYHSDGKNLPVSSVDSDGAIEQFIYDADGKMISKRDKDGRTIPVKKTE